MYTITQRLRLQVNETMGSPKNKMLEKILWNVFCMLFILYFLLSISFWLLSGQHIVAHIRFESVWNAFNLESTFLRRNIFYLNILIKNHVQFEHDFGNMCLFLSGWITRNDSENGNLDIVRVVLQIFCSTTYYHYLRAKLQTNHHPFYIESIKSYIQNNVNIA